MRSTDRRPWFKRLFAENAQDRTRPVDKAAYCDLVLEIIRRTNKQTRFKVLRQCWRVEQTFGRMMRWLRLVRDDEKRFAIPVP